MTFKSVKMLVYSCLCDLVSIVGLVLKAVLMLLSQILLGSENRERFYEIVVDCCKRFSSKYLVNWYSGFLMPLNKEEVLVSFSGFNCIVPTNAVGIARIVKYEYLQPANGDIVVDVGAHYGFYTILASRLVGDRGKVLAFEPHPKNYERLLTNINSNNIRNVVCFNKALDEADRQTRLYISSHSERHSISFDHNPGSSYDGSYICVESVKLDTIIKLLGIKKINLIKIDVEGAESNVLRGAKTTIKQFRPALTIAAYHYPNEVIELWTLIQNMEPSYKIAVADGSTLHATA